jgi:nitrite reductase/ring-hydroxylating ferredoxin subunit
VILCALADLADPGAIGVAVDRPDGTMVGLIVVRRGGNVRAYVDSCPHAGTPLAMIPDRYLTRDGTELLCATHGARFAIDTGLCVAGPCVGRGLRTVAIRVADGAVALAEPLS